MELSTKVFRGTVACLSSSKIGIFSFLGLVVSFEKFKGADVVALCDWVWYGLHLFFLLKWMVFTSNASKLLILSLFHYLIGQLCGIHKRGSSINQFCRSPIRTFKYSCAALFLLHFFQTKFYSSKAVSSSVLLTELPLKQSYDVLQLLLNRCSWYRSWWLVTA